MSFQRDDKSLLKEAWFGSRDQFLHAQLWNFSHGMLLTEINVVTWCAVWYR